MKTPATDLVAALILTLSGLGIAFPLAAQEQQGPPLKINVSVKCEGRDAVFEVLNEGPPWPGMARISVYRTDTRALVSSRQMRMTAGQKMAYKAKGSAEDKIEVGLWVEPGWYKRPFAFDAVASCD